MARRRADRLTRLASAIESLSSRDDAQLRLADEVDQLRPLGAQLLYRVCMDFTVSVNQRLKQPELVLDPTAWPLETFRDGVANLIQINLRGRLLQIEFKSTDLLISTEDFDRPYVLEGAVRSFNQESLDRHRIDEQQIYFCRKKDSGEWYFVDRRLYRTGRLDEAFLIHELERLI